MILKKLFEVRFFFDRWGNGVRGNTPDRWMKIFGMLTYIVNGGRTAGAAEVGKADGWKPLVHKGFRTFKIVDLTNSKKYAKISNHTRRCLAAFGSAKIVRLNAQTHHFSGHT